MMKGKENQSTAWRANQKSSSQKPKTHLVIDIEQAAKQAQVEELHDEFEYWKQVVLSSLGRWGFALVTVVVETAWTLLLNIVANLIVNIFW